MKFDPEQMPGQMDVYDVLADIEKYGDKPPERKRRLTAAEVVRRKLTSNQHGRTNRGKSKEGPDGGR